MGLGFILAIVLTGLIVGALGRLALPGRDPMGVGMTILVGIGGSLIGGLVGRALFSDRNGPGMILSVAGAVLLVWLIRRRRTPVG